MIGSMPHANAAEASALLDKYPLGIPAWPQLPKRAFEESMMLQYTEGFPGMVLDRAAHGFQVDIGQLERIGEFYEDILAEKFDRFSISEEYAQGLHFFLKRFSAQGRKLPLIKGQAVGPFTMGLGLHDHSGVALWFDGQYRDVILKGVIAKALWQVHALQSIAEQVILFFDEPILSALGTPAYMGIQDEEVKDSLNEAVKGLQSAGAKVGIHCCGNMDWGLLAQTNVDIIAFDAYYYGEKITLYPEEIKAFLDRGGALAFGIVPTSGPGNEPPELGGAGRDTILRKLEDLFSRFHAKGIARGLLQDRMLFTPSCGMGTLPVPDAEKVLRLLSEIGNAATL